MQKPSVRFSLRAATASDHDKVDAAFAGFDLRDRAQYRAFLMAQAAAHLPIEAAIDRTDIASTLPDWSNRRRAIALRADLAELDVVLGPATQVPTLQCTEAALGAAYVLEGSRLGGAMLVRAVPEEFPRRFLGAGNPALWRKLIEVLDQTLVSEGQLAVAIEAARAVFARFEASARCHREGLLR